MKPAFGSGGRNVRLSYDASTSMPGIQNIRKALASYEISTRQITTEFDRVLTAMEGDTVQTYIQTVQQYTESAKIAVESIQTFVALMERVHHQVTEADRKSKQIFDTISI